MSKEELKYAFLAFEDIRFDFNSEYRVTSRISSDTFLGDAVRLRSGLEKLLEEGAFGDIIGRIRFRPIGPRERRKYYTEVFHNEGLTVYEAIVNLIEIISRIELELTARPDLFSQPIASIRSVLPQQKLAPVQFEVIDDRLVIAKTATRPNDRDVANVDAAKAELSRGGAEILEQLKNSNCDQRLISSVTYLHDLIIGEGGPIQIGICNIGCEAMASAFKDELPDAVKAMLHAYSVGVSLYVGQFAEWSRFVENASSSNIDQKQISQIYKTATTVVDELRRNPETVDPEVPATLSYLSALISDPMKASKKAAFAVMRTLENLVIKTLNYSASFIEKTAEKTIDSTSTTVSRLVAVSFMTIALAAANGLVPVSASIREIGWVKSAVEIVEKQLMSASGD